LAYADNARLKPYQIYLLGRPRETFNIWTGPMLKDSMAFRAMAVSFAKLLSPANAMERLETYEPNSASIYMPSGSELQSLIRSLLDKSIIEEQRYYLSRYAVEVGSDAIIAVIEDDCSNLTQQVIQHNRRLFYNSASRPYGEVTKDEIGNVSIISRPFHEDHVTSLNDSTKSPIAIMLLDCSTELLEHFRVRHPLANVRTWCNIMTGLRTYCVEQCNSGDDALHSKQREITSIREPKMSIHQRETFLALRLMIVAAARDCYSFGVNYCKNISATARSGATSLHRTLKIYRLISYLFPIMQQMMSRGLIDIRSIWAITESVTVRERLKYKYKRVNVMPTSAEFDPDLANKIIGDKIETIFQGFESYSQSLVNIAINPVESEGLGEIMAGASMVFDISIGQRVDEMIKKLGLQPSGPRNIIDLGDDDIQEYDDL
jgi:hypothetical protein